MERRTREKLNVYQSIVAEYKKLIELGAIKYGEKLPSCRTLAYERGINPNTVEKAYARLEEEGYVRIVPKKGAYADHKNGEEQTYIVELKHQLSLFKNFGVTRAELEAAIDELYSENIGEENQRNDRN